MTEHTNDELHKRFIAGIEIGIESERKRIFKLISDLKDQFAFAMDCETQKCLEDAANSIVWSERWQLTFNQLIDLLREGKK